MTIQLVAILGYPLEHTLSPMLHNASFSKRSIDWIYIPLEITEDILPSAVRIIKGGNFKGLNITMPYKETFMGYLDHKDESVSLSGSVNTVVVDEKGSLRGFNTDIYGIVRSLNDSDSGKLEGKKALIIGAGGVARAAVVAVSKCGCSEVYVHNRNLKRAEDLRDFMKTVGMPLELIEREALEKKLKDVDILINATPVGMYPNVEDAPVEASFLREKHTVVDLIYRPEKTRLILEAEKRGAKIVSGLGVFMHQAARAFHLWTGEDAPLDLMSDLLKNV